MTGGGTFIRVVRKDLTEKGTFELKPKFPTGSVPIDGRGRYKGPQMGRSSVCLRDKRRTVLLKNGGHGKEWLEVRLQRQAGSRL